MQKKEILLWLYDRLLSEHFMPADFYLDLTDMPETIFSDMPVMMLPAGMLPSLREQPCQNMNCLLKIAVAYQRLNLFCSILFHMKEFCLIQMLSPGFPAVSCRINVGIIVSNGGVGGYGQQMLPLC